MMNKLLKLHCFYWTNLSIGGRLPFCALSIHFIWLQDTPTYFVLNNCYFLQSDLFGKEVARGRSEKMELT